MYRLWTQNHHTMIHIYIFDRESIASNYGIGTYIHQIVRSFDSINNISVNIVKLYSEENEYMTTHKENYCLHQIPRMDYDINTYCKISWFLLKTNDNFQQDKIICHFNYSDDLYLAKLIKGEYPNIQIVLTIHYQQWCFALDGNINYFVKHILEKDRNNIPSIDEKIYKSFLKEQSFYNCADCIICLSVFTKDIVEKYYHIDCRKVVLIKNQLEDKYNLKSNIHKKKLRDKYFFDINEKLILFVGRLNRTKGIHFLIDSFREILKDRTNYRLLIVGDGDLQTCFKLSNEIWSKIVFFGHLDNNTLYDIYQISDVGVLPSMHEQCSYTAIEMMMFGLPIITSDSTGLNEMVSSDKLKVKLHYIKRDTYIQPEDLKSKIIYALNNEKEESFCNISRSSYLKWYSGNNFNKMELLYKSLFINN